VRPDKLTLAALAATLAGWKTGAWRDFPVYRAASAPLEELEARGERLRGAAAASRGLATAVVPSQAAFGGGTSPEKLFPSRALALTHATLSASAIAEALRRRRPPVVARIEEDRVLLDLRSIAPGEDPIVADALAALC
jgi:L-seryl-tRNA(Ser) seleniumtransferase